MEEIIKKWEAILKQDKGKNITYDRNVLRNMLDDFKEVINTFPKPLTNEMHAYLLVNALRSLTEEQRKGLCLDLYSRSENKDAIYDAVTALREIHNDEA